MLNGGVEMKLNKGSITVEASIIIPLVIFITILILYIALIQYESAVIHREAEYAATNIALYDNPLYTMNGIYDVDVNSGKSDYPLYWQLFYDIQSDVHEQNIRNDLDSMLILPGTVKVDVSEEGFIINKKIVVDIEVKFATSIDSFIQNIGLDGVTTVHVISKQTKRNSSEFIRNYDLVSNFILSLDAVDNFKSMLTEKTAPFIDKAAAVKEDGVNTTTQMLDKMIDLLEGI